MPLNFLNNGIFPDNARLNFGTGSDMHIRHTGTYGVIENSVGDTYIKTIAADTNIYFQADDGSGGSETYFYLDGVGGGAQPFTVWPDDAVINLGTGHDLRLQHTGTTSKIDNYTGDLEISNYTDDGDISLRSDNGSGGSKTYLKLDGGIVSMIGYTDLLFGDDLKLKFGDSQDLEIYHNGSHSWISDQGTGNLNILTTSLNVNNAADTANMIVATQGGSVNLYYDGTQHFRTTSSGAEITGGLTTTASSTIAGANATADFLFLDDVKASFGTSGDLEIYHDGSNSYIDETGTGSLYIKSAGAIRLQSDTGENMIYAVNDGAVNLYHNNVKTFETTAAGATVTGDLTVTGAIIPGSLSGYLPLSGGTMTGDVTFNDNVDIKLGTSNDCTIFHDGTDTWIDNGTGNLKIRNQQDDGNISFYSDDGSGGIAEYFFVSGAAGQTIFYKTTEHQDNVKAQFGNVGDMQIYHDSNHSYLINGTGNLYIAEATDDGDMVFQCDDGSGGLTEYFKLDGGWADGTYKYTVWPDNGVITLGAGADLSMYHDATNSFIINNTGDLYIRNNADDKDIIFQSDDGSGGYETYFYLDGSGSRNVSNKNFRIIDSKNLSVGSSDDLILSHNGTNSYVSNYTGDLYIENSHDDGDIIFKSDDGSGGTATYMYLDGGNTRVQFNKSARFVDSAKVMLGTSDDLQLYHDGTDSLIRNTTTGNLYIENQVDDKDIIFKADDGSGGDTTYFFLDGSAVRTTFNKNLRFIDNARAEYGDSGDLAIYHNGTTNNIEAISGKLRLIQTEDDGDITFESDDGSGGLATYFFLDGGQSATDDLITNWPDNSKATFGTSRDLQIFHDAANSYINEVGTGNLYIQADSQIRLGSITGTEKYARFNLNGKVELFYDNAAKIETTSGGVEVTGLTDTDSLLIGTSTTVTAILDEDNMASDSATALATQQSIKAYVDNATTGVLTYQGTWNADTNSPTLSSGSGTPGEYYIVSVAGSTDLDGITDWAAGDWAVFSDLATDAWQKIDNTAVGNVSGSGANNRLVLWSGTTTVDSDSNFYMSGTTLYAPNLTTTGDITVGDDVFIADSGIINLGSDNDLILFHDGADGVIRNDTGHLYFDNLALNQDIYVRGNDGGSTITALYLDMSAAGAATFNDVINMPNNKGVTWTGGSVRVESSVLKLVGDSGIQLQDNTTITGGSLSITGDGSNAATLTETGAGLLTIATVDDFVIDCGSDITLDAGGNDIRLFKDGTEYGKFKNDSSDLSLYSSIQDKDILFKGNDGGSTITALQLDMSNAGYAYFNDGISAGAWSMGTGNITDDIYHVGDTDTYFGFGGGADTFRIVTAGTSALTIDSSQAITCTGDVQVAGMYIGATNISYDLYNNGTSYFNGNVTVDAALSITAGALSISGDGSNAVTLTESGSGDFTIDAPDDIRLDAGGGDIVLRDDGTEYGRLSNNSGSGIIFKSSATDTSVYIQPNGTGNVYCETDTLIVTAAEGEAAKFLLRADEADNNGDDWYMTNETSNELTFKNNVSGSQVTHLSITPSASVSSSIANFAGKVQIPSGYVGRDDHNAIFFSTDDQIIIRVADTHRVKLNADGLLPYADSSYDLGSTSLRYSNIWVDNINGGTPTTGGPYLPLSGGTVSGNVAVTGTTTVGSSTGNGAVLHGSKAVTLTENTFTTTLTVTLSSNTACYVKIFVTGDWNSHSAVQYLGEYFLANSDGSYNEPGMIIREVDNTNTDSIVGKIVDPSGTSGNRDFVIQLKADDTVGSNNVAAKVTYEVMGQYVSVS